jgi:hypothetical protein
MGYEIRREVLAALKPGQLTTAERLLLLEIADLVHDGTRQGWPGRQKLAAMTDLSEASIPGLLNRIGEKWGEIRVQISTDPKGRPVYARKGHCTIFRFPTPATLDDDPTLRWDDDPTLGAEGGTTRKPWSHLKHETWDPRLNKVGPPSTPTTQYHSKINHSSSSARSNATALFRQITGAEEEEAELILKEMREQIQPPIRAMARYLRGCDPDDLQARLDGLRASTANASAPIGGWDQPGAGGRSTRGRNGHSRSPTDPNAHGGYKHRPYRDQPNPDYHAPL